MDQSPSSDPEIEERRHIDESLHLFRFSIDQAGDAIFFTRPDGHLFDVNDTACRRLGYTREQMLAMNIWEVDPDYPKEAWLGHWEQLKARGRLMFETSHRRRDGSKVPVEVVVQYLRHGDREFACGFARDITERKRAQTALAESEQRFRAIFDCINDAIFVHDPETGTILDVNERMCEMYGYPRQEALRLEVGTISSGAPPYSQAEAKELLRKAAAGQPQLFEWHARHKNGRLFWVEVNMRLATVGGRDRVIVAVRDISERHRLEEQLRQRTEELALEGERKDVFLAMLGHELRNPLAPIRTAAQALRRLAPADARIERAGTIIERQVRQLVRLIDDLLDVSRIARGKILLRKERLELVGLLQAVADDHRPILESARISLEVDLSDPPVWVAADSARLAQVVGNLLQNARKFTDAGGCVRLQLGVDRGAREASIVVRDTGIGIAPELLASVFVPFQQIEPTPERNRGGLGLGLALVKGLVELQGGRVEARSAGLGRGAEFIVTLPLDQAADERPATVGVTTNWHSRRVLIVEDNPDAAATLLMFLRSMGHEVREAGDAAAALDQTRQWRPEIIVCDIALPGSMDGYGLARIVRRDAALRNTYLIALSGHGMEEDKRRAREAGFDIHVTKPADPMDLERLVAGAPSGAESPGRS